MLILGTCSQCLCVLLLPKLQGRQLGYTLVFVDTHHCQPHGNFYWLLESNNRTLLLKNAWGCCLMLNGVSWYQSVPWDCLFAFENRCGAKGLLLHSPALLFVRLVSSEVILLCLCYSMSLISSILMSHYFCLPIKGGTESLWLLSKICCCWCLFMLLVFLLVLPLCIVTTLDLLGM